MKSRRFKSFLFLVVLLTAVVFSCDESLPDPIYGNKPVADFTATQSQSDIFTWSFTNIHQVQFHITGILVMVMDLLKLIHRILTQVQVSLLLH